MRSELSNVRDQKLHVVFDRVLHVDRRDVLSERLVDHPDDVIEGVGVGRTDVEDFGFLKVFADGVFQDARHVVHIGKVASLRTVSKHARSLPFHHSPQKLRDHVGVPLLCFLVRTVYGEESEPRGMHAIEVAVEVREAFHVDAGFRVKVRDQDVARFVVRKRKLVVDGRRTGKDQLASVRAAGFQNGMHALCGLTHGSHGVVAVEHHGGRHAQMHDRINVLYGVGGEVADRVADDLHRDTREVLLVAGGEVIVDRDAMPGGEEAANEVGADKSGAARNEDVHSGISIQKVTDSSNLWRRVIDGRTFFS